MRRRGFTLIELTVALVIAGLVALLVYGSAQAGFDTGARVTRHRDSLEAETLMRAMIADALRHPAEGAMGDDTLFALEDRVDRGGVPQDRIRFLSRGIVPPFGASGIWRVTLEAGPDGLRFTAMPESGDSSRVIAALLPGVRGLDVQAMSLAERRWTPQWGAPNQMPAALTLMLLGGPSPAPLAPLVVRTELEALP